MKARKLWIIFGIVVAVILLLWWLFAGTLIEETANSPQVQQEMMQQGIE